MPSSAKLDLNSVLGHYASDRRMDILRQVDALGSISGAAREVGVSYKAAWQAIETLGNLAGQPVVLASTGGSGGGGASLTEAGRQVLRAYDLLTQARIRVIEQLHPHDGEFQGQGVDGHDATHALTLPLLGLRTSMRNQLPCTVVAISEQGPMVCVSLVLSDRQIVRSHITSESVQLLGLAPGQTVIAMCKAAAVRIFARDPGVDDASAEDMSARERVTAGLNARADADAQWACVSLPEPDANPSSTVKSNVLSAHAVRVSSDRGSCEVTVQMGRDVRLVGFCALDALVPEQPVTVCVDPAAIVLVLPN